MQQTVSSTRTCSEFVQEHVVPCLVSALLKRQIYEIVHLSQGGLTEGFFCHFLISFNRVYFFSSSFLPSLTAVWVWVCDCVREGGIGKSSPLLHWQLLIRSGAEKQDITRQPISLWIMSYLSLCPAFPFRYTFLFFFHSGSHSLRQTSPQGGETGGMHTSHPQTDIEFLQWIIGSLFFVRNDQLLKGTLNMKNFKDFLKVRSDWNFGFQRAFITTFCCWCLMSQGSQVLLASQLTLTSTVGGKVVCCVFRPIKRHLWGKKKKKFCFLQHLLVYYSFPCWTSRTAMWIRKCHHEQPWGSGGGGGWNVNFEGTVSFMWCGNVLLRK